MGSKMGPNYACLFVGYAEKQIMRQYRGFVPQLHKRYIDDVVEIACCSRVEVEDYINFVLFSFHPVSQNTHTISESDISFLDINLCISGDYISTSIHYKDTDTHRYLQHLSSHPRHCKESLPYNQLLRFRRLCSNDADLIMRGYSPSPFKQDLNKIRRVSQIDALRTRIAVDNGSRYPLVITYHPLNERIKRNLPPLVAYRRDQNVRDHLVHTADRNVLPDRFGVLLLANTLAVRRVNTSTPTPACKAPNAQSSLKRPSPVRHRISYISFQKGLKPETSGIFSNSWHF